MTVKPDLGTRDGRMEAMSREAAANPRILALGGGLPAPESMPRKLLAHAFAALMDDPEQGTQALQYGWPEGHEGLRAAIANRLRARGAEVNADEIIVTSGAQQGVAIAAAALRQGPQPHARMQVDPVSYPGALEVFRERGYELTCARASVRYVLPGLSLPVGVRASDEERASLLQDQEQVFIEDDAYVDLAFDGAVPRPLMADARDRTWHVGTFSKVLCPGLRVGWLVPPPQAARDALAVKREIDLHTSGLSQSLIAGVLRLHDYDARLRDLRRFYLARARALAAAIEQHLPTWRFRFPDGGFAIWLEPDDGSVDEARLMALALAEGMNFDAGSQFRADGKTTPLALRLCFSCNDEDELREGVARLARAWHKAHARPSS